MVWEQGSSVIVMLTRLVENGVEQSARYWPEKGKRNDFLSTFKFQI